MMSPRAITAKILSKKIIAQRQDLSWTTRARHPRFGTAGPKGVHGVPAPAGNHTGPEHLPAAGVVAREDRAVQAPDGGGAVRGGGVGAAPRVAGAAPVPPSVDARAWAAQESACTERLPACPQLDLDTTDLWRGFGSFRGDLELCPEHDGTRLADCADKSARFLGDESGLLACTDRPRHAADPRRLSLHVSPVAAVGLATLALSSPVPLEQRGEAPSYDSAWLAAAPVSPEISRGIKESRGLTGHSRERGRPTPSCGASGARP